MARRPCALVVDSGAILITNTGIAAQMTATLGLSPALAVVRQNHAGTGRNTRILKFLLEEWYAEPSARHAP